MGVLVLAVAVVSAWWLFVGSDTTYQYDANGVASGPYEVPQVLGCVLVVAVLTFGAALLLPGWVVAAVVTVAITAAWSVHASAGDVTGLWAVGAVGVFLGTLVGSVVVAFLAEALRQGRLHRSHRWPERPR